MHKVKVRVKSHPLALTNLKIWPYQNNGLLINIPESIEGSWYEGEVYVGYKDAVLQPSSALRQATELHDILLRKVGNKTILLLFSDGGPDHRLTYICS